MSTTRKIQLEIYSDKADKFYLALLKYKLSGKADLDTLKELADAIHFDNASLESSFVLSEEKSRPSTPSSQKYTPTCSNPSGIQKITLR